MPGFQEDTVYPYVAVVLSILIVLPVPLVMFFVGREIRKVLIGWNIITPPTNVDKEEDDGSGSDLSVSELENGHFETDDVNGNEAGVYKSGHGHDLDNMNDIELTKREDEDINEC